MKNLVKDWGIKLNPNQIKALEAFREDVGEQVFMNGAVGESLRAGKIDEAGVDILAHVRVDGVISEEVLKRREDQFALFTKGKKS